MPPHPFMTYCGWGGRPSISILMSSSLHGSSIAIEEDRPDSYTKLLAVYMDDNSWIVFILYIVRSHAHQHCHHAWPNHTMNECQWSACSWLLYCSMQRVMFRPCTHMSDHVHLVQSESDMIEYLSLSDWPYVISRQNNPTEPDHLMVNSLYLNGAHFHGYTFSIWLWVECCFKIQPNFSR